MLWQPVEASPRIASPWPIDGAVDQPVALDHADAEADQLDLALCVDAGHRRGLAAEQRAARAPAALGDAAQRLARALAVELAIAT